MDINSIASTTVVLSFLGGTYSYFVLSPLKNAIHNLDKVVNELRTELQTAESRRHALELKVAEIEQRARSAHHRIDRLEGVIDGVGHE